MCNLSTTFEIWNERLLKNICTLLKKKKKEKKNYLFEHNCIQSVSTLLAIFIYIGLLLL